MQIDQPIWEGNAIIVMQQHAAALAKYLQAAGVQCALDDHVGAGTQRVVLNDMTKDRLLADALLRTFAEHIRQSGGQSLDDH